MKFKILFGPSFDFNNSGDKSMKTQAAFSLIEVMITVAVAGILAVSALPSMKYMILNGQMTSKTNHFIRTLNHARNEAITQGATIVIEPFETSKWGNGWQVVQGNEVLGEVTYEDQIDIQPVGEQETVRYNYRGRVPQAKSQPFEFVVCNRDKELRLEGRKIVVKSTGSVSVERSVDYQCTL